MCLFVSFLQSFLYTLPSKFASQSPNPAGTQTTLAAMKSIFSKGLPGSSVSQRIKAPRGPDIQGLDSDNVGRNTIALVAWVCKSDVEP